MTNKVLTAHTGQITIVTKVEEGVSKDLNIHNAVLHFEKGVLVKLENNPQVITISLGLR